MTPTERDAAARASALAAHAAGYASALAAHADALNALDAALAAAYRVDRVNAWKSTANSPKVSL